MQKIVVAAMATSKKDRESPRMNSWGIAKQKFYAARLLDNDDTCSAGEWCFKVQKALGLVQSDQQAREVNLVIVRIHLLQSFLKIQSSIIELVSNYALTDKE